MLVNFDGNKLRQIRVGQGISQAYLAEMTDSSIRYIRALEVGEKNNPSAKMVGRISIALGSSVENFLHIEEDEEE